jgi:hypothetical protein
MAAPLIPLGMGLARAAPWLARLGPWLTRGSGWGRKAKGIAGSPGTAGVLRESTRPVAGSVRGVKGVGRRTRGTPASELGMRVESAAHPIGGAATASARSTPGLPAGYLRRHPYLSGLTGAGVGLGATTGIYGALGDEEEVVRAQLPQPKAEWAPPEDLLSFSEQAKADAAKGRSDMKKMLKYGFLIAAAGGSPDKFFERASEMSKMSAAYTQNERYAKQFDAVFREGDMPDSPQMAYKRLVKVGMGPKEAAEITGQVAQLTGKTETERAMNTLSQVYASQGEDAAARLLMTYWATGQLDLPEHLKYAKEEDLFEAARAYVGGAGVGAAEATGEEIGEITPG